MRSAILLLALAMGCTDVPRDAVTTSDICTNDDPGCGPGGSNPVAARAHDLAASNYAGQADGGSERISCSYLGSGEYSCGVSFTVLGHTYGGSCVFETEYDADCGCDVVTTWSCTAGAPR